MLFLYLTLAVSQLFIVADAHSAFWHPSMWGFNVTDKTYPYDNRPVVPIKRMTFQQWWFHGHLDHPPNDGDVFELPAGGAATAEIACTKSATTYFASSDGGDIRDPNKPEDPCPGGPTQAYHTNGIDDLGGCALAIAYKSDVNTVNPEDFTVFSVNQTCVFYRNTQFQVPAKMPPCPPGGCTCAWFWIHREDSGGEENYMNGFKCNVTGSTSDVALATPKVPRRCGADPKNNRFSDSPSNCTYGAKQPFYWYQQERNTMFEGDYSPPLYQDLYAFFDGAQEDIFQDSYASLPDPSPAAAMPVLRISIPHILDLGATLVSRGVTQLDTRTSNRTLEGPSLGGERFWSAARSTTNRTLARRHHRRRILSYLDDESAVLSSTFV